MFVIPWMTLEDIVYSKRKVFQMYLRTLKITSRKNIKVAWLEKLKMVLELRLSQKLIMMQKGQSWLLRQTLLMFINHFKKIPIISWTPDKRINHTKSYIIFSISKLRGKWLYPHIINIHVFISVRILQSFWVFSHL